MYRSTRDENAKLITASKAILAGLAFDGGLYIPDEMPNLNLPLADLMKLSYQDLAYEILHPFFDDFTTNELKDCIKKAYDDKFSDERIAPLNYHLDNPYLELFYGPTIAFKDIALQLLPHLMTVAAKKNKLDKQILILTATSGDTGKAAMEGFSNVSNTQIFVFYPKDGVSSIQEKQMLTQKGKNTFVVGIDGNFDVAQSNVKKIFNNQAIKDKLATKGFQLSSANSINIGRLFPQVVYYFYAYSQLVNMGKIKIGEKINFSVPTGNFGDILAGYYAKKLGLPINKLICASNKNNVLTDFFNEGIYDKNRPFYITNSPSMDILISSNLERLLFYITGENAKKTSSLMEELNTSGKYTITSSMREKLSDFSAFYADEKDINNTIFNLFEKSKTAIDPHTAVGLFATQQYIEKYGNHQVTVTLSTASPYKFPQAVLEALKIKPKDGLLALNQLQGKIKLPFPKTVKNLFKDSILHHTIIKDAEMENTIYKILNI